jgi:hypothetical protein
MTWRLAGKQHYTHTARFFLVSGISHERSYRRIPDCVVGLSPLPKTRPEKMPEDGDGMPIHEDYICSILEGFEGKEIR